jgi:hypothetical protein
MIKARLSIFPFLTPKNKKMKKLTLLVIVLTSLINKAQSQITKGNWIVGGNASISSQTEKINSISTDVKGFGIIASPNIGYFFIDKLSGGIRLSLNYNQVKYSGLNSNTTNLGVGPFIRYYFLNPDAKINLLAESAYQYIAITNNSATTTTEKDNFISFSVGPVIYFNSSVGLEFIASYQVYNGVNSTTSKTLSFNVGFQIHLER